MEFLVIPQLSRTIIECYSAGSDSDDCGRFLYNIKNNLPSGRKEKTVAGQVFSYAQNCFVATVSISRPLSFYFGERLAGGSRCGV